MDVESNRTAKLTGPRAWNLNPLITDRGDHGRLEFAWWWLHIGGKPAKFSDFSSRDGDLTSWWSTASRERALAPTAWYIEKGFRLERKVFGLAAIATMARTPDGSPQLTYSLIARHAVGATAEVHHRIPLIATRELHGQ